MPYFSYEAVDGTGVVVKDEGEFPSIDSLFEVLRGRGLALIKYRRRRLRLKFHFGGWIKRTDLAEFFRNLSLLIRGGIPLRQAIEDLAKSPGNKAFSSVLKDILRRLDQGQLLSEAMDANRRYFSRLLITLVSIGEETGGLDQTLEDAAAHLERVEEIVSNTKRAMIYPSFVIVAMLGAFAFWMIYVLPKILGLFKEMGVKKTPLATIILIKTVEFFNKWWPAAFIPLIAGVIIYLITKRNERVKYLWDLFWSRFPLIGRIIKSSQLAFFFEYLALLTSAGINFVRGLELMEASINHRVIRNGIRGIKAGVMGGRGIFDSFSKTGLFDPFVLRMISVGEQTGNMPDQLVLLAKFYLSKVNKFVETMSKVIEPALIIFAGLIFVVIALGLLGPIYDIISKIQ
ncbi:type II secretion system F family protein [Dissulfurimicrobium hydrothermale]|uniref:type II secretion system F family protein n=1 Tax=Dissulfurimicrobium hydrothermale TaxID=1750598 RepID=UPI001EDB5EB4|nr:type II secretion system F family protein [Dissulfurimicrobium hydrothermale]UKL12852.1 type II secretion system F family protein [Dissulfurimicrobium hydrothermale]